MILISTVSSIRKVDRIQTDQSVLIKDRTSVKDFFMARKEGFECCLDLPILYDEPLIFC